MLQDKLNVLGLTATTDLIVVSDHGHSSVSGPLSLFPLRAVKADPSGVGNTTGDLDPNGFSVSGDVRLAHLMTQAKAIVIAANGGSEYLYVPDHDATTVENVVKFLESREEIGAIFVASSYGSLPGTMSLDEVKLENSAGRNPDIVASYDYDETAVVQGMKGIEFESAQNYRGMHGTFGPMDVHNTLVALGPRFKSAMQDTLPSGNVDVAPTVAAILGLSLPSAAGRSLDESLVGGKAVTDYTVTPSALAPTAAATGLSMVLPTNTADASKTTYTFQLNIKDLSPIDSCAVVARRTRSAGPRDCASRWKSIRPTDGRPSWSISPRRAVHPIGSSCRPTRQ
jgi:arylsulfatase A-like enzyme